MTIPLLRAALLLGLLALAPQGGAATPPEANAGTLAPGSNHTRIAALLVDGDALARSAGRPAANELARIAERLRRSGARPLDGADDLAAEWQALAQRRGAVLPPSPPLRGRVLGPGYRRVRLAAAGRNETQQMFLAGQPAQVTVVPTAPAALQLRVTRPDAAVACTTTLQGENQRSCQWLPIFTERYGISVANGGSTEADVFIIIN